MAVSKRTILSVSLIVCLTFMLGGCDEGNSDISGEDEAFIEETTESTVKADIIDEDADLSMLECDSTNDADFYLLRNDRYYILSDSSYDMNHAFYSAITLTTNQNQSGFFSFGDVPVPVLREGDTVIFNGSVPELHLTKVSFYGYTVGADGSPGGSYLMFWTDSYDALETYTIVHDMTGFTVTDSKGNSVKDQFDLIKDDEYTVSWYEDSDYNEVSLLADCRIYVLDSDNYEDDFIVEGYRNDDGYMEYDLSEAPAGLYRITIGERNHWKGVIAIK